MDYISLDIFRSLDFANREIANPEYITSPTRAVRKAIELLRTIDPAYINGTFIDCAAGKGKPSLVAMKMGYQNFVQIERDANTFKILSDNFSKISRPYKKITKNLVLGDFLQFDDNEMADKYQGSKATFWLFDLQSAIPEFLTRIEILCQRCSITDAVVLLLSEKDMPEFLNWNPIASMDLDYDDSRHIWIHRRKLTTNF